MPNDRTFGRTSRRLGRNAVHKLCRIRAVALDHCRQDKPCCKADLKGICGVVGVPRIDFLNEFRQLCLGFLIEAVKLILRQDLFVKVLQCLVICHIAFFAPIRKADFSVIIHTVEQSMVGADRIG